MRILAMSDLHLSKKPWQVRKALRMGSNADLVLLAGNLVNDGTPEQWACMHACIAEVLPDTPVLAVAGNHDYPRSPSPMSAVRSVIINRWRSGCWDVNPIRPRWTAAAPGQFIVGKPKSWG